MHQETAAVLSLAILVVYVVASVGLVPFVAIEKKRSAFGWAVASLAFSPLLTLIALAGLPQGMADEPISSFDAELRSR